MARSVPSLRENAPASSSARTSRNPSAPPKSVAASAFFLRITPYPLRLWIGEFFRGSLGFEPKAFRWAIQTAPASNPIQSRAGLAWRGHAAIRVQVQYPPPPGKNEQVFQAHVLWPSCLAL